MSEKPKKSKELFEFHAEYSIMINGDEFPRSLDLWASSSDDAKSWIKTNSSPENEIIFRSCEKK